MQFLKALHSCQHRQFNNKSHVFYQISRWNTPQSQHRFNGHFIWFRTPPTLYSMHLTIMEMLRDILFTQIKLNQNVVVGPCINNFKRTIHMIPAKASQFFNTVSRRVFDSGSDPVVATFRSPFSQFLTKRPARSSVGIGDDFDERQNPCSF